VRPSVTDLIVITSGAARHVRRLPTGRSRRQEGPPPIGVEGEREAEWVLVDLGDIVVHVMLPRTREFYGLERLWTVGDDEHPAKLDG
jgi:ribosome-associated protein